MIYKTILDITTNLILKFILLNLFNIILLLILSQAHSKQNFDNLNYKLTRSLSSRFESVYKSKFHEIKDILSIIAVLSLFKIII